MSEHLVARRTAHADNQSAHALAPKRHTSPKQPSHANARSGGEPLNAKTQNEMSARFGHDFSNVRVHTDQAAGLTSQALGAHAYTVGEDIVFGEGRYAPGSNEGDRLLAHELTHVVQQDRWGAPALGDETSTVSQRSDPTEVEADAIADRALSGQSLDVHSAPTAAIHRFQPPQAGDQEWTDKRNSDLGTMIGRGAQAIPGIGNIVSGDFSLLSAAMGGYDRLTGDDKTADFRLRQAEDFGLNAIPGLGNIRAASQAVHDSKAVSNDDAGVPPSQNLDSVDQWNQKDAGIFNSGIGNIFKSLF